MKKGKSIQDIIKKYLRGRATKDEERQLFSFYRFIERRQVDWDDTEHGNKADVENNILEKINDRIGERRQASKHSPSPFKWWKAVAAIIFLCGTIYFLLDRERVGTESKPEMAIRPGSDKAYLQLADGRIVYLDSSANEDISSISGLTVHMVEKGELVYTETDNANNKEEMNTITVPKGGQFKVTLADGTSVWLNASSSLTYPARFSGRERRVKLTGEAYFDVSKRRQEGSASESIPFIVETDKQLVEVLGTVFNINAYADESAVRTTLVSGSVKVTPAGGHSPKILKPGQQSILAKGTFDVEQVHTEQPVAWRHGDFTFDEMPLEEIMRQLARWYDIEVTYQGEVGKVEFGGSISRSKNIREVLDVLELTGVQFTVKGRRIMVTP